MPVVYAQPIEQYPAALAFSTTPTMTNVDAAYPAAKLVTQDPTAVARTTAGNTAITWDFGLNREFDLISLIYTNTSYAATLVIEASANGLSWTTLRASHPLWAHRTSIPGSWTGEINDPRRGSLARNMSLFISPEVLTYRYIRLTVSDPQTTNLTFGRLFVGKTFSPNTGIQYGSNVSFSDSGRRERTEKGPAINDPGQTYVTMSLKMDFLNKTEMYDYAYEFDYWRGSCREVFACTDTSDVPNLQKNSIYGNIVEGRTISSDSFNSYSKTWIIESIM